MMTPIRSPGPLQRLAWLKAGRLTCTKDFNHPDGSTMFLAGRSYELKCKTARVTYREYKVSSKGVSERVEYVGTESAFLLTDEAGKVRWFVEGRLGRGGNIRPVTDHDFTFPELVEHFEIPEVKSLADERPDEYLAAIERLKCLTQS